MRKYSSIIVDGKDRSPSRSMLRAVGFKKKDFKGNFPAEGPGTLSGLIVECNETNGLAKKVERLILKGALEN